MNESWVKEKIAWGAKEEIFQEAFERQAVNVWIQFTKWKNELKEEELSKLKELGCIVNWEEVGRLMEISAHPYYKAIIPREHLDDIAKLDFVSDISKW